MIMPTDAKHGLSFSGGGFRATLFHLGVVKLLRDTGLLRSIRRIGSVSGGSILAAHLVLCWDRYTGDEAAFVSAAKEVIEFCRSDVRGNVARSWILAWLLLVPRLLKPRHWTFTKLLQAQYVKLFKNATLGNLHPTATIARPQVIFYCTSLSTGSSCAFGRSGFWWTDSLGMERNVVAPEVPIAYAIAASSAFPPLFPPIAITNEELFCGIEEFEHPHYLTDGGVFDNLGINRMIWHERTTKDLDDFIVSDAEGDFDWEFHNDYKLITSRNIRASDVLMKRVSTLQYELLEGDQARLLKIAIGKLLLKPDDPTVLSPAAQRGVRNIRTDLDAFSDVEIGCLLQHGYSAARQALIERKLIPEDTPGYAAGSLWPAAPPDTNLPQTLRSSRYRKLGLWSARDHKSWAAVLLLLVAASLPVIPWYLRVNSLNRNLRAQSEVLQAVAQVGNDVPAADPEALRRKVEESVSPQTAANSPRLYIQVASESQRERLKQAIAALDAKGYIVPGIENVRTRAPEHNQLRYYRDSDKAVAEAVARELESSAQLSAAVLKFPQPKHSKAQHLELWVGDDW